MTNLRGLATEGSPGYSVDARGLPRIANKVYVPEAPPTLAALLICHVHEKPSTGHPGLNRMVRLLSARLHLKDLEHRVARYLKNCPVCCKLARDTGQPPLLRPLPVPDSPWRDISVDFVAPLRTSDGFNMIMVVVDRLTKMRHYIPCTAKEADSRTSAPAMAQLFLDHLFRLDGLPDTIVSDPGSQFIRAFSELLTSSLGIKRKLSTACHSQTDGQTEWANQDLENYLRQYVSWKQDDWAHWLSVAEFTANAAPSATTGLLPFHTVYWYEPRMDFDIPTCEPGSSTDDQSKHHALSQAEALAVSLKETWSDLMEAIRVSQAQDSSRENEKRRDPVMAIGVLAYLDTRHLPHGLPTPKLHYRWTGPYRVEAVHGSPAKLRLPAGSKIHLTVNLSYLRQFDNNPLPGQATDAESPDLVIAGEDPSADEFQVTCILDARINRQYCGGRLQFRVSWHGWPDDPIWYNADDSEFCHAKDALDEFYALPSTVLRRPRSAEVSQPSPPTDKSRDKPSFPGGGGFTGHRPSTRSLHSTHSLQAPISCP